MSNETCRCGCGHSTGDDSAFSGTKRKYLVEITSPGFDMDAEDFDIILRRGLTERVFHKGDLRVETVTDGTDPNIQRHNYYLCVDTAEFGTGNITAIVHAYVPDTDFDGGIRDEYDKFTLTNVKPL